MMNDLVERSTVGQGPLRPTMYKGTNGVTFGGYGSSNTGDTHNEPFRASVGPGPDSLYVVVRHSRNYNSPGEWAAQRLPGGLQRKKEEAKVEVKVQIEVRSEV